MWIRMLQTYIGRDGHTTYVKDMRYDLPESVVGQLTDKNRKKLYKKTCAPWEQQTDQKALRLAEDRQAYELANAKAITLFAEADDLKQKADACVKATAAAQAVNRKAEAEATEAKQAAEKKGVTDKAKKKAVGLAREHEKAAALFQIAHAKLTTLLAESQLRLLEAQDAHRQAKDLAAKGGPEQAQGESKADDQPQGPPVPPGEQPAAVQDEVKETSVKREA